MPIKCRLCDQEFSKIISSTHLKKHNITSAEYKSRYGDKSLASEEYRQQRSQQNSGKNNPNYGNKMSEQSRQRISEANSGATPWNKGIKLEDTTAHKDAAQQREQRYCTGELERRTHSYSSEMRAKVSKSIKQYAADNPKEMRRRAAKATETKKSNGYDLAFFKGKAHTLEARKKISAAASKTAKKKHAQSIQKVYDNAAVAQCEILDIQEHLVTLRCKQCDAVFNRTKQYLVCVDKFREDLCDICYPRQTKISTIEQEIYDFVESLDVTVEQSNRSQLPSKREIDIFAPEYNLGIEVNGIYWHSQQVLESNGHSKTRDLEKYLEAYYSGIQLITIYDTEWITKQDIVKSRISGFFGKNKTIGARKCRVVELDSKTANQFLKDNHSQGSGRSNVRYGLYYEEELVSVMTFSKENISRKVSGWEVNRFAHKQYTNVVGAASRLFKHFVRTHNPEKVISYSDNRWGSGTVYKSLGMRKDSVTPSSWWYFQPNDPKLYHRFSMRKNAKDDQSLTEWQNRQNQGWNRIWDCGNTKWVWEKS